jgi:hypothetical protein
VPPQPRTWNATIRLGFLQSVAVLPLVCVR